MSSWGDGGVSPAAQLVTEQRLHSSHGAMATDCQRARHHTPEAGEDTSPGSRQGRPKLQGSAELRFVKITKVQVR